jgi:hypothetical protein
MSKLARGLVAVGSLVALTFGMGPVQAVPAPDLDHTELCSPDDPSDYTLNIDNPYFPLKPGSRWVYTGIEPADPGDPTSEDEPLGVRITVLKATENIYSGADTIVTRVVREFEWADEDQDGRKDRDEELIEISLNYFAQNAGTVCYFGETVDIFHEDGSVTHDGSWRADDPGNAPGIFMPVNAEDLNVGTDWLMEDAPGVAVDRATIEGSDDVTVPAGTFQDALEIEDCNTIDGDCGTKFYASGPGLIVDGPLKLIKFTSPGKK